MTEKCEVKWQATEDQIDNIIIPAMQGIAQQCADYAKELQCPTEFIAVRLRDVANAFEHPASKGDSDCSCC